MIREEVIKKLRWILTEAVEFSSSVCLAEEDREFLETAIKALEQEPCRYWQNGKCNGNTEVCEDAISRQDVLDLAKKGVLISNGSYKSVCKAINEIPSVNPQPCEDAISRQAVIDSLHSKFADGFDSDRWWNSMSVLYAINKVPPVNPTKTGHWIEHPEIETSTPEYLMFYECSECGDRQCFCKSDIHKKRFCGNCGCRMVEPQES